MLHYFYKHNSTIQLLLKNTQYIDKKQRNQQQTKFFFIFSKNKPYGNSILKHIK